MCCAGATCAIQVRFDIGFIGRGNPEITLDKVTRFEREIEVGRRKWYLATFIIVDRIGEASRVKELARRVRGTIIQMSMSYWPQVLAQELRQVGYQHELARMPVLLDQVEKAWPREKGFNSTSWRKRPGSSDGTSSR